MSEQRQQAFFYHGITDTIYLCFGPLDSSLRSYFCWKTSNIWPRFCSPHSAPTPLVKVQRPMPAAHKKLASGRDVGQAARARGHQERWITLPENRLLMWWQARNSFEYLTFGEKIGHLSSLHISPKFLGWQQSILPWQYSMSRQLRI